MRGGTHMRRATLTKCSALVMLTGRFFSMAAPEPARRLLWRRPSDARARTHARRQGCVVGRHGAAPAAARPSPPRRRPAAPRSTGSPWPPTPWPG
eukprot:scaffold5086_cov215-Prasinococcus_capsulatus_cf.AAC.1